MRRLSRIALAFAALVVAAGGRCGPAAQGGELYYVLIFGSQSSPKALRKTHTWATFVKAEGEGTDANAYRLTAQTISWLPRTLDVHVWRHWAEPGVNLSLDDTIRFVLGQGENVRLWGPFVVTPEIWERAGQVIQLAESGQLQYRAIDGGADRLVSDCIHAVTAVDPQFGRSRYPLIRVGIPASRYIARQFVMRSVYDQYQYENSWLIPRLGLDRYPITVVAPGAIPRRGCLLCTHE